MSSLNATRKVNALSPSCASGMPSNAAVSAGPVSGPSTVVEIPSDSVRPSAVQIAPSSSHGRPASMLTVTSPSPSGSISICHTTSPLSSLPGLGDVDFAPCVPGPLPSPSAGTRPAECSSPVSGISRGAPPSPSAGTRPAECSSPVSGISRAPPPSPSAGTRPAECTRPPCTCTPCPAISSSLASTGALNLTLTPIRFEPSCAAGTSSNDAVSASCGSLLWIVPVASPSPDLSFAPSGFDSVSVNVSPSSGSVVVGDRHRHRPRRLQRIERQRAARLGVVGARAAAEPSAVA